MFIRELIDFNLKKQYFFNPLLLLLLGLLLPIPTQKICCISISTCSQNSWFQHSFPGRLTKFTFIIIGKKPFGTTKRYKRQLFTKLTSFLLHAGFVQSYRDYSLFTLTNGASFRVVLIYVDDILVSGNDEFQIQSLKQSLDATFSIKNLGHIYQVLFGP